MELRPPASQSCAFSLVEIVIAIGLLGFALLAILGLLTVGMNAGSTSKDLVEGAALASQALAERRQAPEVNSGDATFLLPPATASGSGAVLVNESGLKVATPGEAAFRLEWNYTMPTATKGICYVLLRVLSPPEAATENAKSLEIATAFLIPPAP